MRLCLRRWEASCCCLFAFFVVARAVQGQTQRLTPAQGPIPSTFFGMHISNTAQGRKPLTPWPIVRIPAWRLWDAGVTWPNLEPAKGQWEFSVLDKSLAIAQENHTEVMLTLGFTPSWASARPQERVGYNPGWAAEPARLEDWRSFVQTVATRYRGRIHIYEIWNEPNLDTHYWTGSVGQMVALVAAAHDIIKSVDPSAIIVSPSPTGVTGLPWLSSFLTAGGGRYVDVIGYHFYVFPAAPEAMVSLIQSVEAIMREHQVAEKPLWDTEAGWSKPSPFPSDELAAAYLARAFILNWASGVGRFYWYAWSGAPGGFVSLLTTEPDGKTLKPSGRAYEVVQQWLTGAIMNWCEQDVNHTWMCQMSDRGMNRWIVWNPDKSTCLNLPSGWSVRKVTPLLSQAHASSGSCTEVGPTPELLTD